MIGAVAEKFISSKKMDAKKLYKTVLSEKE
jgi:hypothetical protein